MARKIFESKTLQEFGGFDYRIIADGAAKFAYEVHGPTDGLGVMSWVAADENKVRQIKEDLLQEYLGELNSRPSAREEKP